VIPERVYRIRHEGRTIAEVPIGLLVGGMPQAPVDESTGSSLKGRPLPQPLPGAERGASPPPLGEGPGERSPDASASGWTEGLKSLLRSPSIASKRWVWEQYDHTVQTNTVIGPGAHDAAVLRVKGERFGIALTMGGNGRYCQLDPYEGSVRAVCEAVHNLVSVGAEPVGITDCLNFANPTDPEVLWSFEQVIRGMAQAAQTFELPFVSGNVSFYNQSETRKIYPTPIVGMVGLLTDLEQRVPMGFQREGDLIYLVGKLSGAVGGSEFLKVFYNFVGGELEKTDLALEVTLTKALLEAARRGLIASAHDVSDGGLLVALAEKSFAKGLGARLEIAELSEEYLFGEWPTRFVVTVHPEHDRAFREIVNSVRYLGTVEGSELKLGGQSISVEELRRIYESALPEGLR
jgi:phosphoribosylformylglycinamidine (FGAM) synthase-like enzyme